MQGNVVVNNTVVAWVPAIAFLEIATSDLSIGLFVLGEMKVVVLGRLPNPSPSTNIVIFACQKYSKNISLLKMLLSRSCPIFARLCIVER